MKHNHVQNQRLSQDVFADPSIPKFFSPTPKYRVPSDPFFDMLRKKSKLTTGDKAT